MIEIQKGACMTNFKTQPWDTAEHLETREDMAAYLEAALEDGDPKLVTAVLGDIARSKGDVPRILRLAACVSCVDRYPNPALPERRELTRYSYLKTLAFGSLQAPAFYTR